MPKKYQTKTDKLNSCGQFTQYHHIKITASGNNCGLRLVNKEANCITTRHGLWFYLRKPAPNTTLTHTQNCYRVFIKAHMYQYHTHTA